MKATDTPPQKKSTYKSIVPAVDQALELISCLAENSHPDMTLTEICDALKIPKSKAYTLLNTLKKHDFVRKDERTKTYSLWLGIVQMARNVLNNMDIRSLCRPFLMELVEKTTCSAHLGIISGDRFYIIARSDAKNTLGFTLRQGSHLHITHGAHGKAIVSFLPDEERTQLLSGDWLCFYGDGEPVDMAYLQDEISQCRELGYAIDPGETNPGLNAVAAPVFDATNHVYGAIVLLGTFPRSQIRTYGPYVAASARGLSKLLGSETA